MQFVWMGSAYNAGYKVGSVLKNGVRPIEPVITSQGPEYMSKTAVRDHPVVAPQQTIPVHITTKTDDTWANWASNHPAAAEAHEVSLARDLQEDMNRAFLAKYGLPDQRLTQRFAIANIPRMIWQAMESTFGYILFTYQDLYVQLSQWNGSWVSLVKNVNLIWRVGVTTLVTMGLIEIVPFLSSLSRLLIEIGDIIWAMGSLFWSGLEEMGSLLSLIWDDTMDIIRRVTG